MSHAPIFSYPTCDFFLGEFTQVKTMQFVSNTLNLLTISDQ